MAPEGVEAVGEVATDLGARRVVARVPVVTSRSPERECLPLGRRHGPAFGPPHVDLARREVHAQVLRLRGIVDRACSRHGVRLEDVDLHAHRRVEVARVVEQPLEREQALGAEAGDRDPQGAIRIRPRGGRPRQLGNDENTPSPMRSASLAGSQPSSRSTQPSS